MARRAHGPVRIVRFALWLLAALAAGALLLVAAFALFVSRPFPDYRHRADVDGLEGEVEILRDEFGVPHIYASTLEDLAFGQGYAHAQDRFWQMEFWRRIGAGRLAEILGEGLVETDRYLRTMGFARTAAEEYRRLPDAERQWLEAYAAGVNAYASSRPPRRLGLEFAVLGLTGVRWEVEAWTPVDTLSWAKIMAQDLSGNLGTEVRNLRALLGGARPLARLLDAPYPPDHPVIVDRAELAAFRRQLGIEVERQGLTASYQARPPRTGRDGIGSNNWVIASELTATGGALLANDMHLAVQMPSIWYEVGLHLTDGELSLRGYSFPGVPGIVAGQNGRIAWGITNVGGDVQDLFLEEVDPENPDRYREGAQWLEMERYVEPIYVEGERYPINHVVRRTVRGPVISDLGDYRAWADVRVGGAQAGDSNAAAGIERATTTALSIAWPALEPSTIVQSIFRLNQASDYESFRDALTLWDVPGQNLVFADSVGNIAYQTTGEYPIRTGHDGQLPALAARGERWLGTVPFDHLPGALNPAKGYIVTANNPVVGAGYEYLLGMNFANGYRARRIVEMIEESEGPITMARIAEIHADVISLHARDVMPFFSRIEAAEALEAWRVATAGIDHPVGDEPPGDAELESEVISTGIALLAEWNHELSVDSAAAAAFAFVWTELVSAALSDEMPGWLWPPVSVTSSETVMHALLGDGDHRAWDDRTTPQRESRDDIIARAIAVGLIAAAAELGDDPRAWRWGDLHTVTFRNGSLGQSGIAPIEALFNRGPFAAPGGPSTVNVAHWSSTEPFELTSIASQRAIYDLADPSRSLFIHPTGQSGHPFHRHYDDFIEPWLAVEYHPANWTRAEVDSSAGRRRVVLRPR